MSTQESQKLTAPEGRVVLNPSSTVFGNDGDRPSRFNARKAALFVADLNAVALSLLLANLIHAATNPTDPVSSSTYFWFFFLTFPFWPLSFSRNYLYRSRHVARSADEASRVVLSLIHI